MDKIKKLISLMEETMKFYGGIGLASTQVGIHYKVAIVSDGIVKPIALINPKITFLTKEEETNREGCLSFPGIEAYVPRCKKIRVDYYDTFGSERSIETDGLLSICIQHECEHLSGKTFLEKMSKRKREMVKKTISKRFLR